LLKIDASERAISHILGLYLRKEFKRWHVDCEYNRKLFDEVQQSWKTLATDSITVFPNIIVHKRGTRNNLLIVEMKKTTSRISSEFDYFKLKEFKYQYNYPYALFLKVITGCENVGVEVKDYLPEKISNLNRDQHIYG